MEDLIVGYIFRFLYFIMRGFLEGTSYSA